MTQRLQIYKCDVCGNIVELLHGGKGELVCCGQPMKHFVENTVDAAKEKHVPVKEKIAGALKVKVGAVPHPMEEKHYIEWVEIIAGDKGTGSSCGLDSLLKPCSLSRTSSRPESIAIFTGSGFRVETEDGRVYDLLHHEYEDFWKVGESARR